MKHLKAMLAGAAALAALSVSITAADAMPVQPVGHQSGIEQVRLVCGPYRCFYVHPYYRRYYHPRYYY